jgi:hypothetical protein
LEPGNMFQQINELKKREESLQNFTHYPKFCFLGLKSYYNNIIIQYCNIVIDIPFIPRASPSGDLKKFISYVIIPFGFQEIFLFYQYFQPEIEE